MKNLLSLGLIVAGTSFLASNAIADIPPPPPLPVSVKDVPYVIEETIRALEPLTNTTQQVKESLESFNQKENALSSALDNFLNAGADSPKRAEFAASLQSAISDSNESLADLQADARALSRQMQKLNPNLSTLVADMEKAQSTYFEETPIPKSEEEEFAKEEKVTEPELKEELKTGRISAADLQKQIQKMQEAKNKIGEDQKKYPDNTKAKSQDAGLMNALSAAMEKRRCAIRPKDCKK